MAYEVHDKNGNRRSVRSTKKEAAIDIERLNKAKPGFGPFKTVKQDTKTK